jgi:uncharacterized membrane protein YdbT with pleckstrin-like domain
MRTHLHGVALAQPLLWATGLAFGGAALLVAGWPASLAGPVALALAAFVAVRAAWRWERTRVLVTKDLLVVTYGTVRRRTAWAPSSALEVEQGLLGRLLGYGTLVAGDLVVPYVPRDVVRPFV